MSKPRLAVIMDPVESVTPHKDSSVALLIEAQRRGWEIRVRCGLPNQLGDGH